MKNLLLIFLLLNSLIVLGQTNKVTRFGFKGGFNQSSINGVMSDGRKSGFSSLDLYAGFFADTNLTEKWNLESELLFSYTDVYHFVEIPIHLKYKLSSRFNIFFGPKLNFLVDNIQEYNNNLRSFGVSGEIGSQFLINKQFFIELRYSKGFTKQFDDFDFSNGKINTLRLGLGINF
jgi:Outer membrane protein beta-barrel domain